MSLLSLCDKYIIAAKGRQVDCYDSCNHYIIEAPVVGKGDINDNIVDVVVSADAKHMAIITSTSKQLVVYDLETRKVRKTYTLPRSSSKIRFTPNNKQILVADKSGDVLNYDIENEKSGIKLLGHLSLLLDILQTQDEKYIITCDRDEKIRVSRYPNTYNIQTYCLGHREFVNHIELLPHNNKYLTSTSGDGTVKLWNVTEGTLCYTINTNDHSDQELNNNFIKVMDSDGVEVSTLPIVHFSITKLNNSCSLIALSLYSCEELLIYTLQSLDNQFSHKLENRLKLESFPTCVQFFNGKLYIYNDTDLHVNVYKYLYENEKISFELIDNIKMFDNYKSIDNTVTSCFETIKVLYKRKFDNVQEYQERKKQRLEKIAK
ncbi:tRNA (guanine-N(7)-)-methyltransferase non-catalytic subunit wuho [Manduca sexta]|uniref:tRNA (guanine-N(7)-)-methyltransferase non-catalytic subunit wuho n=1 Tax=Manduca sexta TaxID=7130 RepID=UPI00188FEDDF|nr:tRNA (guanine-N(7)-)-methyltransferase non-catalytic subunit wuho [Manduca sexta]